MKTGEKRSLIIGLGSGRCGTTSLSRFLNDQPDSRVLHEGRMDGERHLFNWSGDPRYVTGWLHELSRRTDARHWGDIAFYFLPYVEQILGEWNDARFVVLKRDVTDTVESFERKADNRNFWMPHDGSRWDLDPIWDPKFPKYDTSTRREAIVRYWNEYYRRVEDLVARYPRHVAVFGTDSLNTPGDRRHILDFVGISDGRIDYGSPIQENASSRIGRESGKSILMRAARRLRRFKP